MARKKNEPATPPEEPSIERWTRRAVVWGVFAILVVVSPSGRDTFRLPKDLVLRAEGIVLVALAVAGLIVGSLSIRRFPLKHPTMILALAAVAWALVSTATSTSIALSVISLWTILPAAIFFIATFLVARGRPIALIHPLVVGGVINALLYLSQDFGIWNPFPFTSAFAGHNASSGLLGNANDVGNALLPIAVAAAALAFAATRHRALYGVAAVILCLTLVVSAAVAAISALFAAVLALSLVYDRKKTLPVILALVIAAGGGVAFWPPLQIRLQGTIEAVKSGRADDLLSGRLSAWLSAARMFADHPVTGIGPGTFGWQYYAYKLKVTEERPDRFVQSAAARYNFEEAHSDHLELLAETGLPGYAIFLASIVVLGGGSRRKRGERPEATDEVTARFVQLAQLPLATSLFVVAIAQYPLQLASSLAANLYVIALCAAWRPDNGRPDELSGEEAPS